MGEILKNWLRARLGVLIDLTPEVFGHYAKDGTLIAQLLHSYDIINSDQLTTIIRTQDPALSRVNLKHLRVWLQFIGVDCDNDCIDDISKSRGSTAIRLVYKLFLCLENKDRLHFITQQKEREKYIPTSAKFDVRTVAEKAPSVEPPEHPLVGELVNSASLVAWHRNKFRGIVEACKSEREKFMRRKDQEEKRSHQLNPESLLEQQLHDDEGFTRKHENTRKMSCYKELCEEQRIGREMTPSPMDPESAGLYLECLKRRKQRAIENSKLRNEMSKLLMSQLWEKLLQAQEKNLDLMNAEKVLVQSQYEKQLVTKFCEIRGQTKRIAQNRNLVEQLVLEKREFESQLSQERSCEEGIREKEDIEAEGRRLCELSRRLREARITKLREEHDRTCREVMDDLVDISLIAAEYRSSNDNCIPRRVWDEWKVLFVKNQSIFDLIERVDQVVSPGLEKDMEEIFRAEKERQDVLNDADFDNYHYMHPPWDVFVPELGPETRDFLDLGWVVLGYIVHRLLEYVYPQPPVPEAAPIPEVSTAVIILGFRDDNLYPVLQGLLDHHAIRLVIMENAINYCLYRYKEEMKDFEYIDLKIIAATEEVQPRENEGEGTTLVKRTKKSRKEHTDGFSEMRQAAKPERFKQSAARRGHVDDKETQTPHTIPLDDKNPVLTDAAYIGKWTYEFLTLGQPISDDLNTKILIEYLKSLTDVQGWVLVNYPNTYNQMVLLESALTGHKITEEKKSEQDSNIDEIDAVPSRISVEEHQDTLSVYRQSRLVPNPLPKPVAASVASYMTAFIKALPKPKDMLDFLKVDEILPEDTTRLEAFYANQGLARALYYTEFDLSTLKRLAGKITRTKLVPGESLDSPIDERDNSEKSHGTEAAHLGEVRSIRPGQVNWKWANFPQDDILLGELATLWENMETVYVQNLREIFFIERIHRSAVVPYKKYVMRHMVEFVKRPDVKQDIVHEFHTGYNKIDSDMRGDIELKCELHCRVTDLQLQLWESCDQRREESEKEIRRIVLENWTTEEAVVVGNLCICMMQAELDRFIDTMQLLNDYYTAMLQKPIAEKRVSRSKLHRLELNAKSSGQLPVDAAPVKTSRTLKDTKVAGKKAGTAITDLSPPLIDCSKMKDEIASILLGFDEDPPIPLQSTSHKAIRANFLYVSSIVESTSSAASESLKSEETSITRPKSSRKLPPAPPAAGKLLPERVSDLFQEWRYAVGFETNRMRMRLRILDAAGSKDLSSLLESMRESFLKLFGISTERYNGEMKSVDDLVSVFRFAIEHELPVKEEMLLDGDRFVVRSNVLMFPQEPEAPSAPAREEVLPGRFCMAQIGRLVDVFRRVAPCGSLSERLFVYVLEDVVAGGGEEGGMVQVPRSWSGMRACDVEMFVTRLFGNVEYVDWREFIVYAMDLPIPTVQQILDMRSRFLVLDPRSSEVVTRRNFKSVQKWFFSPEAVDDFLHVLHEDFERDEAELYEEEEQFERHDGRNNPSVATDESQEERLRSKTSDTCSVTLDDLGRSEVMRMTLAQEVLCELFRTSRDGVNYTAFLLAFCKDLEPLEGLGKALSLAMGGRVCVDEVQGEQFVIHLLEQRRLFADAEFSGTSANKETLKIVEPIVDDFLFNLMSQIEDEILPAINLSNVGKDVLDGRQVKVVLLDDQTPEVDVSTFQGSLLNVSGAGDLSLTNESWEGSREKINEDYSSGGFGRGKSSASEESAVIYWVPREACQALLVASLPWHARQPDLLQTTKTLQEQLKQVYVELRDVDGKKDVVLAHRLVRHEFMTNLLASTSKFTTRKMADVLDGVLRERDKDKFDTNC